MAQVYTLANAKGGCGKSTVAFNLAVCFARSGYRSLAVDLDQQGNLSAALGVDLNELKLTDTPPAMRAATLNGLAVADVVLIPIESSYFALLGLGQLLQVIAAIREAHQPNM